MAKENSKLTEATQKLRTAQDAYHRITKKNTAGMTPKQLDAHQQACADALAAKRLAAAELEAVRLHKPLPKAADMAETSRLASKEQK